MDSKPLYEEPGAGMYGDPGFTEDTYIAEEDILEHAYEDLRYTPLHDIKEEEEEHNEKTDQPEFEDVMKDNIIGHQQDFVYNENLNDGDIYDDVDDGYIGPEENREEVVMYYDYHRMDSDPDMYQVHTMDNRYQEGNSPVDGEEFDTSGAQSDSDHPSLKTSYIGWKKITNSDIDSTSLTEQKQKTKQHWEEAFSSPDVQLFPGDVKPATGKFAVKPVVKSTNHEKRANDYESAIDREIRLAQEREEELRREKESRLQETSLRNNKGSDKVKSDSISNNKSVPNMPIHKITTSSTMPPLKATSNVRVETKSAPPKYITRTAEMLSPQSYRELTEVDRDSVPKQESIIEREIREQMQREEALRQEESLKHAANVNKKDKEAEQSEYEHREKEQERLGAHESIIEREIRLQRERDLEVQRLRALSRGEPANIVVSQTQTKTESTASVKVPSNIASSKPNYSPAVSITNYSGVHSSQDTDMPRNYNPSTGHIEPDITYSDAIAGKHHEGESLIAKELREQREREEELRQHWESLGFDVPKNARDPPDTPFNMPEPRQPPPMKTSFSVPGSLSNTSHRYLPTYQKEMKHSTSYEPRNVNNSGANSSGKSGRRASTDSASSRSTDHSQLGETSSQVNKSKVQPYKGDSDDEESDMYRFVPLTETPVEREIRLAKEREDALRKEKGLPSNSSANGGDHQSEVLFEVRGNNRPTQLNYRKGVTEDDKGKMKRFASSRLQLEIEKEKQREMDLKSVGKINTLSEERVGPSTKYIDIISKDGGTPLMPKSPITPKSPSSFTISQSTKSVDQIDYGTSVQNGPASSGFVQVTPSDTKPRSEQIVVKRFPSEYTVKQKASSSGAESMIERELREMKEREDELRAQRERVSGKVIEPPEDSGTYNFEVQYRHNGTADNTVKTNRRKSALAEEWEKKFGAAS